MVLKSDRRTNEHLQMRQSTFKIVSNRFDACKITFKTGINIQSPTEKRLPIFCIRN